MIPQSKDITYIRNQLTELKNLEDKYLEDSLIRLKENSLKKQLENQEREKKMKELDKDIKNINNSNKIQKYDTPKESNQKIDDFFKQFENNGQ